MDQKNTSYFFNKNLVLIDSIQFVNSSLDKLVKNLSDKDFKYLVEEFGSDDLELLKQEGDYFYKYMNILKDLMKKDELLENIFTALKRMEKLVMMVKYQMVT